MIEGSKVQRDKRQFELKDNNNEENAKDVNEEYEDNKNVEDKLGLNLATQDNSQKQKDGSYSNPTIDSLLEKLKTNALISSPSRKSRQRKSQYRRSKALSFYSSMT